MKNQAGPRSPEKDAELVAELEAAGITPVKMSLDISRSDVQTGVFGHVENSWAFYRFWYYWSAEGPGIPVEAAEALHNAHGQAVRVDGHCGCPHPREHFKGLGVGRYHVDTAEGLKALADTIKSVMAKSVHEQSK